MTAKPWNVVAGQYGLAQPVRLAARNLLKPSVLLAAALLLACLTLCPGPSARAEDAPPGDGSAREKGKFVVDPLFTQWCARCHNINGLNAVCPDLSTIGTRRDEAYIRQSIVDPNAYIVPGFPRDVMPRFSLLLKPEEVDQLVKFLLTLKGQTADPNIVGKKVQW